MAKRKNPNYPPYHCFTVVSCEKCGELYEPICKLRHICKKQNSYPNEKRRMAKCENCYHARTCGNYPNTGIPEKSRQRSLDEGCENFRDKSLIIELPCRVGDEVYIISRGDIVALTVDSISYNSHGCFLICSNEKHFGYGSVSLDMDNKLGAEWYLNREDAERALEERE